MSDVLVGVKPNKYNKISQQKKFHLLTLIYKDNTPIRQAAQIAGINYLTAKTIIFFHKNHCKSYQFQINKTKNHQQHQDTVASYSTIRKNTDINQKLIKPKSRIQVICSIGNILSPPRNEHQNSPTNCSNCLDNSAKPLPLMLEPTPNLPPTFPTHIVNQDFSLIELKRFLLLNLPNNKQLNNEEPLFPPYSHSS